MVLLTGGTNRSAANQSADTIVVRKAEHVNRDPIITNVCH